MRVMLGVCVLAAGVALAQPADALPRQPSDFLKCDGQPKPGAAARRAGAALATTATLGFSNLFYRAPEAPLARPAATGLAGVEACDVVLAHEDVANDWARRAQMLRFRAMHNLVAGNANAALEDIARMREVAGSNTSEIAFARSIGASASFVEAAALSRLGRFEEAEARLAEGLAARPYAPSAHSMARWILVLDPAAREGEVAIVGRLAAVAPAGRVSHALALDAKGDLEAAADAWAQLAENPVMEEKSRTRRPVVAHLMRASLAAARAGRLEQADAYLQRAEHAAAAELAQGVESALKSGELVRNEGVWVRAMRLLREGDAAEANALIEDVDLKKDFVPALVDIRAQRPARPLSIEGTIESVRAERSGWLNAEQYLLALPEFAPGRPDPNSPVAIYEAAGFTKKTTESGGVRLSYAGARYPLPTAEEALYLWAADLAKQAGKRGFSVDSWSALDATDPRVRAELARLAALSPDFTSATITVSFQDEPANGMPFLEAAAVSQALRKALSAAPASASGNR